MSARLARWILVAVVALGVSAGFPWAPDAAGQAGSATSPVDIPADAIRVGEGGLASIEDALAVAEPGATIVVDGGTWAGPLAITTSVHLIGVNNPVIDGGNDGTVVHITAPDTVLQGFTIRNSGTSLDREDSAVLVEAQGVQVLDNDIVNALFGVNAATAHDLLIERNTITGMDREMGVRGDGIKVWYSHRTRIVGNHVEDTRDLLVWYSNDVVVSDNTVHNGRYGFHFMNSDNGVAERNQVVNNSVAIYLMYGRNFVIRDNLMQGSRGPSGHGLGLKEIDGVLVSGNIAYDNRIGIFIDNSPLSPNVTSYFRDNLIIYNDQGLGVLPSSRGNVFSRNSLIDNLEQVAILGGGQMGDNLWSEDGVGNFWSDYAGYDADGDGVGDLPFRSEQLSEQVMGSWPVLQLFRFSVAEAAVDFGSRAVPMFRQEPKLVDEFPLISPVIPTGAPLPATGVDTTMTSLWSLLMLAGAAGAIWWGVSGSRLHEPGGRTPARRPSPIQATSDLPHVQQGIQR